MKIRDRLTSVFSALAIFCFLSCGQNSGKNMSDNTNRLINESSPYLLQHAGNPVDWYPWGEEALDKARSENKMILVSIGYSACHWCHVMERECFEDDSVARVMNENFICIKVDREERPDIDQVYMSAVQLMTGRGGWPLNCFALPDGRPVYGGTYFPRQKWLQVMSQMITAFNDERSRLEEYAEKLTDGVAATDFIEANDSEEFSDDVVIRAVDEWKKRFDKEWGGPAKAPKFPLPGNYEFLLQYGHQFNDREVLDHVKLTLDMMATRGIYDLVGGGFARYSTDDKWKVPHFEKMLYDNAQLISLYSKGYKFFKDPLYKDVILQTIEFIERELSGSNGNFYSALDADSEGEEGKYYIWTTSELQKALGDDYDLATVIFSIDDEGHWEHGQYILMTDPERLVGVSAADRNRIIEKLLSARSDRIRPGLDDKSITAWNAMMVRAYTQAYFALGNNEFLDRAISCMRFILEDNSNEIGGLNHTWKNGNSKINGYLDDHVFTINALIGLYEATLDRRWIDEARGLAKYVLDKFSADKSNMFYYTSIDDPALISRKMETQDNVIPASNSEMAAVLYKLGKLFDKQDWVTRSYSMVSDVIRDAPSYGAAYSNWLIVALWHKKYFMEVVACGDNARTNIKEMRSTYLPGTIMAGTEKDEYLPILHNRFVEGADMIYVCENYACKLPVGDTESALELLH
jgi:uncharacterized protein YyaL (SSP411 family)